MGKLRAALIAGLAILTMTSPLFSSMLGGSHGQSGPTMVSAAPLADDNGNSSNGNGGNDNGSNGNGGNDNGGNDNGGNGNGGNGSNDNGGNGNGGGEGAIPAASPVTTQPTGSLCAPAGQQTVVTSADGRIAVTVFPTMSRNVKITILTNVSPSSVPALPGQEVDNILFQVQAEYCEGGALATLPAEVNLGIHYSDAEAAGLNEASFTIGQLDRVTNQWSPTAKQVPDPANNYISATITDLGFYAVYQR